jgi:ATP-dependent helicase/nuclease subunit A
MAQAWQRGQLFREQPFVMGVPADQAGEGLPHEEMVTIQGIIDAFLIEEGNIVLVDYKTDRVSEAGELVARYQTQLNLYAEALQKAYGIPVSRKLIYSTALGCEISL